MCECKRCGSEETVSNGHSKGGKQRYYCKSCKHYGTVGSERRLTDDEKEMIFNLQTERVSQRGIGRVLKVSKNAVMYHTKKICA